MPLWGRRAEPEGAEIGAGKLGLCQRPCPPLFLSLPWTPCPLPFPMSWLVLGVLVSCVALLYAQLLLFHTRTVTPCRSVSFFPLGCVRSVRAAVSPPSPALPFLCRTGVPPKFTHRSPGRRLLVPWDPGGRLCGDKTRASLRGHPTSRVCVAT